MKDYRMMARAEKLLPKSDHPQYQMAAILVRGGNIIASATNKNKPSRWLIQNKVEYPCGRHAEANLLWNLDKSVTKGATIYVVGRVRKTEGKIVTKPCFGCRWFADYMGVSRIVYVSEPTGQLSEANL